MLAVVVRWFGGTKLGKGDWRAPTPARRSQLWPTCRPGSNG
ncbi:MAG: hypothetical protein R2862_04560 [Thermoanaerobaculia bacterium]